MEHGDHLWPACPFAGHAAACLRKDGGTLSTRSQAHTEAMGGTADDLNSASAPAPLVPEQRSVGVPATRQYCSQLASTRGETTSAGVPEGGAKVLRPADRGPLHQEPRTVLSL